MTTIVKASLKSYNTFGLDHKASELLRISDIAQLEGLLPTDPSQLFILGGGSNILLTGDIDIPVWKNEIRGIKIWKDLGEEVIIKVGGGEVWHDLVLWAIEHELGGIENLSLIPGTVGAAPIQNIGAYGVELTDTFHHLEAYELATGKKKIFEPDDCSFGYRDSYFKRDGKNRYFITHVYLRLKKAPHNLSLEYGAIQQTLSEMGVVEPGIKDVSNAVISIRSSKLPDPRKLGNSGSFFKNPVLPVSMLETLRQKEPDLVYYPQGDDRIKVPAGWLIQQSGWKGYRKGDAGCYEKQALVLVNYGGATGADILQLANEIKNSVKEKFGIDLEPEVNIL